MNYELYDGPKIVQIKMEEAPPGMEKARGGPLPVEGRAGSVLCEEDVLVGKRTTKGPSVRQLYRL